MGICLFYSAEIEESTSYQRKRIPIPIIRIPGNKIHHVTNGCGSSPRIVRKVRGGKYGAKAQRLYPIEACFTSSTM